MEYKGYMIEVDYDPDPIDPRTFDNLGRLKLNYPYLPDEPIDEDCDMLVIPVYGYVSPQFRVSTMPQNQVLGKICVSYDTIRNEYGDTSEDSIQKARKCLETEVAMYDTYIAGCCKMYHVYEDGELVTSCCGFFSEEDAIKDAKRAADHITDTYDALHKKYCDLTGCSPSLDEFVRRVNDVCRDQPTAVTTDMVNWTNHSEPLTPQRVLELLDDNPTRLWCELQGKETWS